MTEVMIEVMTEATARENLGTKMSIRVGNIVILHEKGKEYQDYLVLCIERNPTFFLGVIGIGSQVFNFITVDKVEDLILNDVFEPETVDLPGTFKIEREDALEADQQREEVFRRGDLVSFSYLEQGAELSITGYYLDVSAEKDYVLISERGVTVRRFWEVPVTSVVLISQLPLRL
jgi:hypothetical protein